MKTKPFVLLLSVFVLIVLGTSLFYRLQLMLGDGTALSDEFFNPFIPQRFIVQSTFPSDTLFGYQNPFELPRVEAGQTEEDR